MTQRYYGYNPPFFGGYQKILSRQADDRLIKNDLKQLILTSLGERVMRPTWGTVLKNSIFEQADDITVSALEKNLNEAIKNEEPRINATASVEVDADRNKLNVKINGTYSGQPNNVFTLEISLNIGVRND